MTAIKILSASGDTELEAKEKLEVKIATYLKSGGWGMQGGISHAVTLDIGSSSPTHYFSILVVQH